ncbi:MAG TPA: sigma-70 family RNA polymerase sigma factor [Vicinamibacterales bacterium]|nr:sigma-70 family RNA polymerase sigma factor [Vicinamibacterales bacterium]
MSRQGEVTRLLADLGRDGRAAVDRLIPLLYAELRQLAHRHLRRERMNHTLDTSALVHEAYLKLVGFDRIAWQNRAHFLAVAAQAMRRVLVDYAVKRTARKRGGIAHRVPLGDIAAGSAAGVEGIVELDAALDRLAAVSVRLTRVVECRYFAGMSIEETADALDVSPATIKRDWTIARAWLNRELGRKQP